jgi:hypothetical protein
MLHPELHSRRNPAILRSLSVTTAAMIAIGGYVHLCLYRHGYRTIPTIGVGFLLQIVASGLIVLALVVPVPALRWGRFTANPVIVTTLAALSLSIGTLIAFWLTRRPGGLFGFQERGLQPAPQALIALVAESVAVLLALVTLFVGHRDHPQLIEVRVTHSTTNRHDRAR